MSSCISLFSSVSIYVWSNASYTFSLLFIVYMSLYCRDFQWVEGLFVVASKDVHLCSLMNVTELVLVLCIVLIIEDDENVFLFS